MSYLLKHECEFQCVSHFDTLAPSLLIMATEEFTVSHICKHIVQTYILINSSIKENIINNAIGGKIVRGNCFVIKMY